MSTPSTDREVKRRSAARYRARRICNNGQPLSVPIEQVQARIAALRAEGLGLGRIAAASGLERRSLQRMANGVGKGGRPLRRVTLVTWERLAAVRPNPDPWDIVPATATHRMLHALQAVGWSLRAIDRERGTALNTTHNLLVQRRVTLGTQDEIHHWYEKLSGGPPAPRTRHEKRTQSIARAKAKRNGWAPPAAWDDILDLRERPKGVRK